MRKIKASEAQVLKSVLQYYLVKRKLMQRNNVGAWRDGKGNYIKYGLQDGSSDLIGIEEVLITQEMVGKTIGQYVALEVKKEGWKYTGTEHEKAQKAYIDLVNSKGGYARFVTCIEDIYDNKKA